MKEKKNRDTIERYGQGTPDDWLERNLRRPQEAEVICHGDFHPLNVMVVGDRLTGVIDWPQAIAAEPAFDVSCTLVLLRFADARFAGPLRIVFEMIRTAMIRRYLAAYRSVRPFRDANTAYYEALRVLSALVSAGEYPPGPSNPWHKPRVLAALCRHFETVSGVNGTPPCVPVMVADRRMSPWPSATPPNA